MTIQQENDAAVVAGYYDLCAEGYALDFAQMPFTQRAEEFLRRAVPGDAIRLLDLGCGPGHLSSKFPAFVDVVGTDISPRMIAQAITARPLGRYFVHDFHVPLPLSRGTFDIVLANGCFEFCSDLGAAFRNVGGVLKTGGKFYFTILERRTDTPQQAERTAIINTRRKIKLKLNFWTSEEVANALKCASLRVEHYDYDAGWSSRSSKVAYNYGYWIATKLS